MVRRWTPPEYNTYYMVNINPEIRQFSLWLEHEISFPVTENSKQWLRVSELSCSGAAKLQGGLYQWGSSRGSKSPLLSEHRGESIPVWEPSPEEVLLQNQMLYAMSCVLEAMWLQQQEHVPTFNYDDSNAAAYDKVPE